MPKDHPKSSKRSLSAMENMIAQRKITEATSCSFKTAYSQGGAHRALAAVRKRKRKRHRAAAYHCRFCGHYHLTRISSRSATS